MAIEVDEYLIISRRRTLKALTIAATVTGLVMSAAGNMANAAPIFLHCGKMVDVRALEVVPERTIVINDKKITRIDRGFTTADAGNGATVIDLKSQTCLPGLIDLHVHLSSSVSANSTMKVSRSTRPIMRCAAWLTLKKP